MNVDVVSKGKNLLSGGKEGEAYLWDLRSALPYFKIHGHRWDIMLAKFVNVSIFISGGGEGKLLIYNINHPEDYKSIELPEQGVVMTGEIGDLDFMEAAKLRDEMFRLQKELEAMKK